jgi:hypothetical protein
METPACSQSFYALGHSEQELQRLSRQVKPLDRLRVSYSKRLGQAEVCASSTLVVGVEMLRF